MPRWTRDTAFGVLRRPHQHLKTIVLVAALAIGLAVGCAGAETTDATPTTTSDTSPTTVTEPTPSTTTAAPSTTTTAAPTTTTTTEPEPQPDTPRPDGSRRGDDVVAVYEHLFDLAEWQLRNPEFATDAAVRHFDLDELVRRGERLLRTTVVLGDVDVWDRPTDDRALLRVRRTFTGPQIWVDAENREIGRSDPEDGEWLVTLTRDGVDADWYIEGTQHLITPASAGGTITENNFIGLAIDEDALPHRDFIGIDRADTGLEVGYGNDELNICFHMAMVELGTYPICFFNEEVTVGRNTFGTYLTEIPGSDVLIAVGWGNIPRWRYWTVQGDRHELNFLIGPSSGRSFIAGAFTGDPLGMSVSSAPRSPIWRTVFDRDRTFVRSAPPSDAITLEAEAASVAMWQEQRHVSCVMIDDAVDTESLCVRELRDTSVAPAVVVAQSADDDLRTIAVLAPLDAQAVVIDTTDGQELRVEPMTDDGRRWLGVVQLDAEATIRSADLVDAEGRSSTLQLQFGSDWSTSNVVYPPF